jgi:hypothetical protein
MAETYGAVLDEVRELLARQLTGWRRLLDATRESTEALRSQDPADFERVLTEQVDALAELRTLESDRTRLLRVVGGADTPEIAELKRNLRSLAAEVAQATGRSRFVLERNGALVEARLGLHRRAGLLGGGNPAGLHRIA